MAGVEFITKRAAGTVAAGTAHLAANITQQEWARFTQIALGGVICGSLALFIVLVLVMALLIKECCLCCEEKRRLKDIRAYGGVFPYGVSSSAREMSTM